MNSSDSISGAINDLIIKANQSAAIADQLTISDKITPIKVVKSKLQISDTNMMSAYARLIDPSSTTFYMPFEPDGKKLRLDLKFDSGGLELQDHSFMDNTTNIGYKTTQPELIKNPDDDGITAGEISSILDGQEHYYYSPTTSHNSVKQMILDGETGITIIYRLYTLKIENEFNSTNANRATLFYYVENDQLEYAIKAEITDAGIVWFYFKYGSTVYWAFTNTLMITPRDYADYRTPDYDSEDYSTQSDFELTPPLLFQDMGFRFNFSTKEIKIYNNGSEVAITTGSTVLTPAPFPIGFADPIPPPPIPVPYIQPYTPVYTQLNETASLKINSITVSDQTAIYNVNGSDPVTDPVTLKYNINPGFQSPPQSAVNLGGIDTQDQSWVPLTTDTSNSNNCTVAAIQILNTTSGLGAALNGQIINEATFWLKGLNGPVGTFFCRIWDGSGNAVHTLGQGNAADTDGVLISVTIKDPANTTRMAVGYRIGIEYSQGATTDIIQVQRSLTDKDPSITQSVIHPQHPGVFSNNNSFDLRCNFTSGTNVAGNVPYIELNNYQSTVASGSGEYFRTGSPMIGSTPTLIQLKIFRDSSSTTVGTVTLKHVDATLNTKATLASATVSSLPTSDTGTYNFTWQNTDYTNPIVANDSITVEVSGVTAGFVYVLTNYNNTLNNNYDGINSCWIYKRNSNNTWFYNTDLDLSGKISSGGQTFNGYIMLDDRRKRTGIKVDTASSTLLGQKITRLSAILKDFGNPSIGNIYCRIRDKTGIVKANLGFFETVQITATDKTFDFINTSNTYQLAIDDTISLEYDQGTSTDAIMVRVALETVESVNTTLFESLISSLTTTTPVANRDLAGIIFIGGEIDTTARPIRGVVIKNTSSILYNKIITEIRIKLKATGTLTGLGGGGTPTGTAFVKVWIVQGTTNLIMSELGILDFSSIPTTQFTEYIFQNPDNTYALKAGDRIDVIFDEGDFANYVEIKVSSVDVIDGTNTIMFERGLNDTDIDDPIHDLTATMYVGGYLVTPDPGVPILPTPYHYAHGWYISSAIPPDSNALVDPYTLIPQLNTFLNNVSKNFRIYSMLLTPEQLQNYYNNRWTISAIPFSKIEIVAHDLVPSDDSV